MLNTFLLFGTNVYSQEKVSLGGAFSVSRTFVVEEDMRIRSLDDKSNDPTYDKVLMVDPSGNIEKVSRDTFDTVIESTNEKKLYYLDNAPQNSSVAVDDFMFYFRPSTTPGKHLDVMLKLANDPETDIHVYYTLYRKFNMYNNAWTAPTTTAPQGTYPTAIRSGAGNSAYLNGGDRNYYKANHKLYYAGNKPSEPGDFTAKNWADGQLLCPGFDIGDIAEVWVSYPGKPIVYRAVFYARQNENTASYNMRKSYTILVEKFGN